MKEILCYLLARIGGNKEPSQGDVAKILESVGIEVDTAKLDCLFKEFSAPGFDFDFAMARGEAYLAKMVPSAPRPAEIEKERKEDKVSESQSGSVAAAGPGTGDGSAGESNKGGDDDIPDINIWGDTDSDDSDEESSEESSEDD